MRVSDTKWPRALVGGFQASLQHGLSAGFGQELSQTLGWGIPAERFAWAAVELGGVPMAAGITRSTPGERAPLLPLTLSHATARGHRTGDQDRWSPTGAAWPASVVPVTPPRTGRATAHRYSPASPSLAVPRVREPAGPLRHVLGLSPARTTTGPPPHPAVVGGQRANPLHPAWIAGAQTGTPGWFPRSPSTDRRVRWPAIPLRYRHGYAADLHHGLPTGDLDTGPGVRRPVMR